jgi:holo-[acyl-carrier protein] synthase
MIVGLGTDIVEIDRIAGMIDRHGDTFLDRVFTPAERAYCGKKKHAAQHYAGRWAAKEAAMKALGTGFVPGVGWHDFEILPEQSGAPKLTLSGGGATKAKSLGIDAILVTMSHCRGYATATAIAVRGEG